MSGQPVGDPPSPYPCWPAPHPELHPFLLGALGIHASRVPQHSTAPGERRGLNKTVWTTPVGHLLGSAGEACQAAGAGLP